MVINIYRSRDFLTYKIVNKALAKFMTMFKVLIPMILNTWLIVTLKQNHLKRHLGSFHEYRPIYIYVNFINVQSSFRFHIYFLYLAILFTFKYLWFLFVNL